MSGPELRDLELFVAVVRRGSITAGAGDVGLSLAAASARIAVLERRYGLDLLVRGRRGVRPTTAGDELRERAAAVLAEARTLRAAMGARAHGLGEPVRLAVNTSASENLVEPLAVLLDRLPGVAVELRVARSDEVVRLLRADAADLGVVSSAVDLAGCEQQDLGEDPLVVVGLSGRRRSAVNLAEVVSRPIVGLLRGIPLQDLIDAHARAIGVEPVYRLRLPTLGATWDVASTGAAPAVVPLRTVLTRAGSARGTVALDEPWGRRRAVLAARRLDRLSAAAAEVAQVLLRHAREGGPS